MIIIILFYLLIRTLQVTINEGISSGRGRAGAYRSVVEHSAQSAGTACASTRVDALIAHASLVARTFGRDDTFGPAT